MSRRSKRLNKKNEDDEKQKELIETLQQQVAELQNSLQIANAVQNEVQELVANVSKINFDNAKQDSPPVSSTHMLNLSPVSTAYAQNSTPVYTQHSLPKCSSAYIQSPPVSSTHMLNLSPVSTTYAQNSTPVYTQHSLPKCSSAYIQSPPQFSTTYVQNSKAIDTQNLQPPFSSAYMPQQPPFSSDYSYSPPASLAHVHFETPELSTKRLPEVTPVLFQFSPETAA